VIHAANGIAGHLQAPDSLDGVGPSPVP
jgi:hypothetical protein